MPQMAPMPWLFLMMCTLLSLNFMTSLLYFSFPSYKKMVYTQLTSKFTLKW